MHQGRAWFGHSEPGHPRLERGDRPAVRVITHVADIRRATRGSGADSASQGYIENINRYLPRAVGLMEIEHLIRYAPLAVGLMEIEN